MNAGAARAHQPGQSIFRAILPEERLAVLVGDPAQPGPYTIGVKMPAGGPRIGSIR